MSERIEDYAVIGDCETAALVWRGGSIDWLCVPRFDSAACFAALLGAPEHGRWLLAPEGEIKQNIRRYRPGTLILETDFETETGKVKVIDFMPVRATHADIIRIVRGIKGEVRMQCELTVRFDYGASRPWIEPRARGYVAIAGPDLVRISSGHKLELHDGTLRCLFTVKAKESVEFAMSHDASYHKLPPVPDCGKMLDKTERFWHDWSAQCKYNGPWKEQVLRSLITLKALTYAPTGGIVAAPTTSLPEAIGGQRNWDYRYCWLRDATFTLYALLLSGYSEEAESWRQWLLRAVAGNPADMQILYGLAGERRIPEMEVDSLPGYENSCPVRIGNAAHKQFQLDVYGELMDSMHLARRTGLKPMDEGWELQKALLRGLEKRWKEPDEGIWEVRGPRRDFTHSKIMAWVAVDRMIGSAQQYQLPGPLDQWRKLRDSIHAEVCDKGYNSKLGSFVQYYGSEELDASLLMIPLVGFLPADDPRVAGTVRAIEQQLTRDGFVLRYHTRSGVDGLPEGEGVFLPCSFWLVDNLILQGRIGEAEQKYRSLIGLLNDVGLISEEYDPVKKRFLGNFPQAFSHVALVNTAWNFEHKKQGPAHHRRG